MAIDEIKGVLSLLNSGVCKDDPLMHVNALAVDACTNAKKLVCMDARSH